MGYKANEKDTLTGIGNEEYLKYHYQNYINKYPDANYIFFDLKSFKHFNDIYGHEIGNDYLRKFASLLDQNFLNSIVVRLHGDEFVVVTNKNNTEINQILDLIDAKILLSKESSELKEVFKYNAGSAKVEHSINETKKKADYMMYEAKNNDKRFQEYSEQIWTKKIQGDKFLDSIDIAVKNREFTYSSQGIYLPNKQKTDIRFVYTRTKDNKSLFGDGNYETLKRNKQLKYIDLFNLDYLLSKLSMEQGKMIVNFDSRSLIDKNDLVNYLELFINTMNIQTQNIIISIDVNNLDKDNIDKIIKMMIELKKLGFGICLDKYSCQTGDIVYQEVPTDYVKFDCDYLHNCITNPKAIEILRSKIEMFTNYRDALNGGAITIPIATCVYDENAYNHALEITDRPMLLSGNYFEKEKIMKLKKN